MTRCSTISLYLTKLSVTEGFSIASSVTYSEIRQTLLTVYIGMKAYVDLPEVYDLLELHLACDQLTMDPEFSSWPNRPQLTFGDLVSASQYSALQPATACCKLLGP